ncbi:hypothetical protein CRUP_029512 [Coryphaenoides rupestris]|nr:hypothetical protein CRUP_029512 [Coryphaenoides rupestris]
MARNGQRECRTWIPEPSGTRIFQTQLRLLSLNVPANISITAMPWLLQHMLALLSLSAVLAATLAVPAAPPAEGACPDACRCSRKTSPERSQVNCHKKGLRSFPAKLPRDAWVLKLGENGLVDLQANTLRGVASVQSVNLERNALRSIHPRAFAGARKLMLLNLYGPP